ncbi:hypothetical protein BY996DRAFT_6517622 [Phakopsora pachyrhizi]|nr:hypothetical protein BY996DRAFT_6517622 [Phakopsora pachyrhizi]
MVEKTTQGDSSLWRWLSMCDRQASGRFLRLLSRDSQGTVDKVKKQIELGLHGSSKGGIQLVVLLNLHLKFRNKERTKEIQDLSQSLAMTNDDSREKQEGTH